MDAEVYSQVKTSIKRALNIDLDQYKEEQMKRRLDSWLVRSRISTWQEYLGQLPNDKNELERLRNYLTINVTEFFRDPNRWEFVRAEILPSLLKNSILPLKLWSAGCSTGAEAYTLAILMEESAQNRQYSILATDLDRGVLAKARMRGPYTPEDVRNLSPMQRQKYITSGTPYFVNETLQKNIRFEEQDLLKDHFENGFDLIVCRNVVIYFTNTSKDALYARFSEALRPGGVLFVGGTEIISTPSKFGLQNYGVSFYRKPEK